MKKGSEEIYLSLVTGSTELKLTDSEGHSGDGNLTTNVYCGDKVTWEILPDSGITSIDKIYKKNESKDIFSQDPKAQKDGSWKGTVSETASGEETYGIKYYIGKDKHDCDPKLVINN